MSSSTKFSVFDKYHMTYSKPYILTESILDDEELLASYNDVNINRLIKEVNDVEPSDCEFYVNICYNYRKLYNQTYWWQKWFTAHINVLDIYKDIHYIATLSGLFKSFCIDKQVKMFGYNSDKLSYINKTWEYPELPEDFDIKAWYENVHNTYPSSVLLNHEKEAVFYVRIYFNFDKNMTHKQFLKHLWKFLPGMNVLCLTPNDSAYASFYRNDEISDDRLELALVHNSIRPELSETFSSNYMFTPQQFDALYTALTNRDDYQKDSGREHNYVQEKIIDTTNFKKLMRYAAEQAKEEYGIILKPGNYQYPDKFNVYQRNLNATSSWCAFTVDNVDKTKKDIEIYELEECIIDCLLYRMNFHYFDICKFAVALRVIPKLVNTKAEEIRLQFIKDNTSSYSGKVSNMIQKDKNFSHFEKTKRPVTSGDVKMSNNRWNNRVRQVGICGEKVILLMADKNGLLNKNKIEMDWPASVHNYMIDLMADNDKIWSSNQKHVHKLTESILDNLASDDIHDATASDVLLKKASREMEDNLLDYEYFIYLRVRNVCPEYGKPSIINVASLYDELINAVDSSWLIPNKYYVTYPHLADELSKFDDVYYNFVPPFPETFDLKELYKDGCYIAAPYIDVKIYFKRFRYCTYPRFIKGMNSMLGYFHQAIKIVLPLSYGVMQIYFADPQNHGRREIVHLDEIYTLRCYQNGEQYQSIYKEMFPGEQTNKLKNLDADAAVYNLRKLDIKRLGVNIERHANEYNMDATVINSYRGIITDESPVPISWITLEMNTLTGLSRIDIREAEQLLIDSLFRHLTLDMITNTNLFIFVRANFDIYNKEFEEKHSKNPRTRQYSYNADSYTYLCNLKTQTMTYVSHTKLRQIVVDPRVREVKRKYGNEVFGFILFFDKNGQMGRKPFTDREYSFGGDACQFIEDVVQTGLIWRPDFKLKNTLYSKDD